MAFDFDDWNKAIKKERMKREEKSIMILYQNIQGVYLQKIENTMNMQMITETEEIQFGEKRKYIDFM